MILREYKCDHVTPLVKITSVGRSIGSCTIWPLPPSSVPFRLPPNSFHLWTSALLFCLPTALFPGPRHGWLLHRFYQEKPFLTILPRMISLKLFLTPACFLQIIFLNVKLPYLFVYLFTVSLSLNTGAMKVRTSFYLS